MILNNYWNLKGYSQTHYIPQAPCSKITEDIGLKATDGSTATFLSSAYSALTAYSANKVADISTNFSLLYGLTARLGTGLTDPTTSDYNLTTDITNSLSNYQVSVNSSGEDGVCKVTVSVSGTNSSNADITINEIGLFRDIITNHDNYLEFSYATIMLIHALLTTPITVPSGQGFTLTFEWGES